jgi:hypothetical protein
MIFISGQTSGNTVPSALKLTYRRNLITKGRKDAHAWAMATGLLPANVEAGQGTQAVPGEEAVEQQLGATATKAS